MARSKEFEESVVLDRAIRLFWEQGYDSKKVNLQRSTAPGHLAEYLHNVGVGLRVIAKNFDDQRKTPTYSDAIHAVYSKMIYIFLLL